MDILIPITLGTIVVYLIFLEIRIKKIEKKYELANKYLRECHDLIDSEVKG